MRASFAIVFPLLLLACGKSTPPPSPAAASKKAEPVKITQFYTPAKLVPRGMKGSLCYGVENASKVALDPPAEDLWPSAARCFEITPKAKTTYTLTATGEDGSTQSKTVDIEIGAAPPRLYDLWVNSIDVRKGDDVKICFKVDNVTGVKVSPGKLDGTGKCLNDKPSKTTTYKITALGGDRQMDSGTVTVKVH